MTSNSPHPLLAGSVEAPLCCQRLALAAQAPCDATVVRAQRSDHEIQDGAPWSRRLRVLVVDDDKDNADSFYLLIKMWGHQTRRTYTAAAALELARACPPDVFALDLAMPGVDGYELARQLRRQLDYTNASFVAITGYSDPEHRRLAAEAGFDHYFVKPVNLILLERLLSSERARLSDSRAMEP